jgi:hypothetical protein
MLAALSAGEAWLTTVWRRTTHEKETDTEGGFDSRLAAEVYLRLLVQKYKY